MGARDGGPRCGPEMGAQDGGPRWGPEMGARDGGPGWWPTLRNVVYYWPCFIGVFRKWMIGVYLALP